MNRSRPLSSPAVVRLAFAIAVVMCLLGGAATAHGQTTALFLDSQPGDWVGGGNEFFYTPADATFDAQATGTRSVRISVSGAGFWLLWDLEFAAPEGTSLQVGEYSFATRYPFTRFAGIDISGQGRGCNQETGRFIIREIVYNGSGNIERFAADFEQHCEDADPGIFGVIRYNSTISTVVPFDGVYPSYRLTTTFSGNGNVTGGGLNCGTSSGICEATYSAPTIVSLTATPDPGYSFEGWTGGCHGSATISVRVNMVRQCSARFRLIGDGQPTTLLMWNSQQGDYIGQGKREIYNALNSRWAVTTTGGGNGVTVRLDSADDGGESYWTLNFNAPSGQLLVPRAYDGATRFASASLPGIDVYGSGRGCNSIAGSFTVHELVVSGGTVTRLALDFEQHCEGIVIPGRPLRGSIRYNSLVPPRPPLAITTVGTGAQVTVSPSGTVCMGRCVDSFPLGTFVQLLPTPQAGWTLSAWSGDADCADGVVTMIAPIACTATFTAATISAASVTPSSGTGAAQMFSLQYSDSLGAADIGTAWVWFNATLAGSSANSCLLQYRRSTSTLFLLDDLQTWMAGAFGSGGTLQNSQCAVNLSASSVTTSGNTLTLNLAITFKPAYAGTKNIFMFAASTGGASSGWQTRGTWAVPGGPAAAVTADSVTPNNGSGPAQTFALRYSDTVGATDLTKVWVWFNASLAGSSNNSCLLYYDRAAATLFLLNDSAATWMPGTLGSGATLQNTQCLVSLAGSSVVTGTTELTLNLAMTFKSAFAGAKNIYMFAQNASLTSGWQARGAWTVPAGGAPAPAVTADSVTPSSGSGSMQTFALQYSDTVAATDLTNVWVWFNASLASSSNNSCLLYYDRTAATLFLLNDSATTWMSGALTSGGTLQNTQCAVSLAGSSVVTGTTNLTLNLAMTFKPAYAGAKNVYMFAQSASMTSGWQTRGAWTVPAGGATPPTVTADSVTPNAGSGTTQVFDLQFSDTLGTGDLNTLWVWFTAAFGSSSANSCLIKYHVATATFSLLNDSSTWMPGYSAAV